MGDDNYRQPPNFITLSSQTWQQRSFQNIYNLKIVVNIFSSFNCQCAVDQCKTEALASVKCKKNYKKPRQQTFQTHHFNSVFQYGTTTFNTYKAELVNFGVCGDPRHCRTSKQKNTISLLTTRSLGWFRGSFLLCQQLIVQLKPTTTELQ